MIADNEVPKFPLRLTLSLPGTAPKLCRPRKRTFASTSAAATDSALSNSFSSAPPNKVPLKPATDVFAGALARAASQSTIHPLDTLKVRLQSGRGIAPPGLSKFGQLVPPAGGSEKALLMMRSMGAQIGSLYRGVVGAASGAGIAIGAYFAFYGAASNALSRHTEFSPPAIAFISGGIAAAGSSVVKVPLAVCIRSVQAGVYPNFFAAANAIIAKCGMRGLFTGYFPTLLEDVPDMAVKFCAYESMRSLHKHLHPERPCSVQEDFAMGAAAGALAAAATTPLDVIKTNMMVTASSRPTMFSVAAQVYAEGGYPAFFRGIGARAVSNGINSAVFFCFFEAIRSTLAERAKARAVQHAKPAKIEVMPLVIDMTGEENLGVSAKAVA